VLLTNGPVIIRLKEIGCRHYACYDVDIPGLDGIIACLKVRDDVGVGEAGGGRGICLFDTTLFQEKCRALSGPYLSSRNFTS
jgi:hypothetical protein